MNALISCCSCSATTVAIVNTITYNVAMNMQWQWQHSCNCEHHFRLRPAKVFQWRTFRICWQAFLHAGCPFCHSTMHWQNMVDIIKSINIKSENTLVAKYLQFLWVWPEMSAIPCHRQTVLIHRTGQELCLAPQSLPRSRLMVRHSTTAWNVSAEQ